jgi:hypothetical protein
MSMAEYWGMLNGKSGSANIQPSSDIQQSALNVAHNESAICNQPSALPVHLMRI